MGMVPIVVWYAGSRFFNEGYEPEYRFDDPRILNDSNPRE